MFLLHDLLGLAILFTIQYIKSVLKDTWENRFLQNVTKYNAFISLIAIGQFLSFFG